jgi:RimJ/RimL family protein N-acetyltransferase
MPSLTPPAIPAGRIAASVQPVIPIAPGLVLRPWSVADAPAVIAAYADPGIRYWHARAVDNESEARALIERWRSAWAAESGAVWAVVHEDDEVGAGVGFAGAGVGGAAGGSVGRAGAVAGGVVGGDTARRVGQPTREHGAISQDTVVGRIALRAIDTEQGRAECAYWIRPEVRGNALAGRALSALTAWAFDEVGFHRLFLVHSTVNEASCRVASKAGFVPEGVERSSVLHSDGWHDMHVHSRIAGLD